MSDGAQSRVAGTSQGLALILIASLPTMAIVSLVPNLPQLFQRFGAVENAGLLVPMILTIPSLCIALFSPLAGVLADRWGRKPLLVGAIAVFSVVGVIPIFVDNLYAVLVTRFPVGLAEAAILTSQNALLGDYFAGERRQRWLGIMSVLGPIFAALLVLAGGMLGTLSWNAPFLLYLLGVPMLIWSAVSLFEPARARGRDVSSAPAEPFPWATARSIGFVTIVVSVLYYLQAIQLGRIFSEHGIDSPARISFYVTIASLGVVAGGWAFPRIARLKANQRFALVFAAYAVGYAGLGLAPTANTALAVALIAQFGNGLAIPAMIGWSLDRAGPHHRGRVMGIWAACFFVGTFLSPPAVTLAQSATGSFLAAVVAMGAIAALLVAVALAAGAALRGREVTES
jgi:MFS family permease